MQPFIHWSLLAISVSTTLATPLSTSSHYEAHLQRAHITLAPLVENEHPHGSINNSYIIMFKQGVSPTLMDNHLNFLQTAQQAEDSMSGVKHAYTVGNSVHGYAGEFSEETVEQLRGMPEVDLIERDQIVRTTTPAIEKSAPWVSHFGCISRHRYQRLFLLGTCPYQPPCETWLLYFHQVLVR